MPKPSQTPHSGPVATEPGIRLSTLFEDLLWPRLFEAVPLALRPERLTLSLITIVLLALVGGGNALWGGSEPFLQTLVGKVSSQIDAAFEGVISGDYESAQFAFEILATDLPRAVLADHAASVFVLGPLLILIWGIGGTAISRSSACEFAMGISLPWPRTLAFALERWRTVLATFLSPWLIIGFLSLIVWVMGLLMGVPYIGVAAAVVFGLVLFVAGAAVVLIAGYVLGFVLLVPAISCEGTDAIDAMQRTYARVLGRPFRLILYMAISAVIGYVAINVVSWFVVGLQGFIVEIVGETVVYGNNPVGDVLGFWMNLLSLLVAAYALSYFHVASTAVYLILRQVADSQDIADLWMPGMIEGTMAESLRARGEVAQGDG